MRGLRGCLIWGSIILLLAVAGCGYYAQWSMTRPVKLAHPVSIVVLHKATFNYVASRLQARGLIPSAFIFKCYARLHGKAVKIRVGEV